MHFPNARLALAIAALFLCTRCDNQQDAIAAGAPQLELRGEIASPQSAPAIAPVDGRVARISVREGSVVQAGTVVAALVNPTVERDVAFSRAQVAVAEQRLRAATRGNPRPASADNGARERAAATILANRESKRNRYRELFKTHDVTKEELENAENEYAAALRDWLAERERATATVAQTDTGLLQLELEKARSEEALAADRRNLLTIAAPIAGTVTRVNTRIGESVFPRDTIVEITDTTIAQVRAAIAPELMRYVRPGMPLQVKVFTVPPRRFTAPVRAIVPAAGGATVILDLPNPDGVLQAGQQAVITVK
jgi:multidrug resistance efflux pump